MSSMTLELDAIPEYEDELGWHGEVESEEFFRRLAGLAQRAAVSPRLRRAARAAARAVGHGLGDVGSAIGGRPGAVGAGAGGAAGAALGRILVDLFPRSGDPESESEEEANPIRRVYPGAMMEHLVHRATETESDAEADALVGALVPLAARLVPAAAPTVMRAAPQLAAGLARATRVLRATPETRPLVQAMSRIVGQTAASIARQSTGGLQVTPRQAVAALSRQTARTLSSPRDCAAAYQRSRALDHAYHRQIRAMGAGGVVGGGNRPLRCPSCGRH